MNAAAAIPPGSWLSPHLPPGSLPLDPEAARVYLDAYRIGLASDAQGGANPPFSFTSVMVALLAGDDEPRRWFSNKARELGGPDRGAVLAEKGLTEEKLTAALAAAKTPPPSDPVVSQLDRRLFTPSSLQVLVNA